MKIRFLILILILFAYHNSFSQEERDWHSYFYLEAGGLADAFLPLDGSRHSLANCVPDLQLDVRSDAASPYDNRGANELADVMTHFGLVDVARE